MDHTAAEQDTVNVAAQSRRHGAYLLADLINHGIPGAAARLIPRLGATAHLERVGRAKKVDEAAGLHAHPAHVGSRVAGVKVVEDLCDGQGAAAGGRHRALAAHDIGAVDHAPAVMGAHADSAADVADHEAALLVGAPGRGGVANGGLLEVEGVQVHVAIHPADAGHPGLVAKLVGVGRVHDERGPPDAPSECPGNPP